MPAFTHELARLICPLHRSTPFQTRLHPPFFRSTEVAERALVEPAVGTAAIGRPIFGLRAELRTQLRGGPVQGVRRRSPRFDRLPPPSRCRATEAGFAATRVGECLRRGLGFRPEPPSRLRSPHGRPTGSKATSRRHAAPKFAGFIEGMLERSQFARRRFPKPEGKISPGRTIAIHDARNVADHRLKNNRRGTRRQERRVDDHTRFMTKFSRFEVLGR